MRFDPRQPPVIFGEALFDCFPDGERVLGGAPFNVAWHLAAFGAAPVFVSRVGTDELGDAIERAMADEGMSRVGLQRDPEHPTGTVQVALAQGEPTYDIVPDRAYDHVDAAALPDLPPGSLLYHGSLALRNAATEQALRTLRERIDPAVFLDVNLRDPWWDEATLHRLLAGATWVKLNADELQLLAPAGVDVETRAQALLDAYDLQLVIATLGAQGALALGAGGERGRVAPDADVTVVDAVGAGDGFASVLILSLLQGWPLELGLTRAQTFASAMVGRRGATVRDAGFYAAFAERWGL